MVTIWEECPTCKKRGGVLLLLGLTSGLGPRTFVCSRCGERYPTLRSEWREKGWLGKTFYLLISLVYAAGISVFGAVFTATSIRFIREGASVKEYPLDAWLDFWPYALPFAAIILGFQCLRVRWSLERSPGGQPTEYAASPWSFVSDSQGLVLMLMLVVPGVCWLLGFLLHWNAT